MSHLDAPSFDDLLARPQPTLVDFSAAWCGPCQLMKPLVGELSAAYAGKVNVGVVDIDEQPDLAGKYAVTAVPTFVFFKDGREVDRLVGAVPRPILQARLEALAA